MTQDKARKRAARKRAAETGESYTRAARLDAGNRDRGRVTVADVPAVRLPAPVALMVARHVRAAELHFGAGRRMAEDYGAPIKDGSYGSSAGPLADAVDRVRKGLHEVGRWAARSAVASGVVAVEPGYFQQTEDQRAAEGVLYPGVTSGVMSRVGLCPSLVSIPRGFRWCRRCGRACPVRFGTSDWWLIPRVCLLRRLAMSCRVHRPLWCGRRSGV